MPVIGSSASSVVTRRADASPGADLMPNGSGLQAGAALQGLDDGWADVDLVEPFDALHSARAVRVDLHHLVADHIDANEVHAVGHELLAHRFDDAAFHVTDLERDRVAARADVGPWVVTVGHSPERGQLPVALVLDHEHVPTFGSVQRLDDGAADLGDELLDRFRVARHERPRSDLLWELFQVELARCAYQGHRVVYHRYASSLEHLAEDHSQWTCPRPLLKIVDRFVSQEQGIEVVHDDPF